MPHTLPPLPYAFDALEPHIDQQTMRLHHGKHHQTYVDKLNAALAGYADLQAKSLEDLLRGVASVPEAVRAAARNHGGGHANHSVFWMNMAVSAHKPEMSFPRMRESAVTRAAGPRFRGDDTQRCEQIHMAPGAGGDPAGDLAAALTQDFGSVAAFREQFSNAAVGVFGSGWVWLVRQGTGLAIVTKPNQESPLMDGLVPLLGLDVWEHAYYLKYQNRRPEYVEAWWNVVNWEDVSRRYAQAGT